MLVVAASPCCWVCGPRYVVPIEGDISTELKKRLAGTWLVNELKGGNFTCPCDHSSPCCGKCGAGGGGSGLGLWAVRGRGRIN